MKRKIILLMLCAAWMGIVCAQGLTLDTCIAMAKRKNRMLNIERLEERKAEETRRQAFTNFFPRISAAAVGFDTYEPLIKYGLSDISNVELRQALENMYILYGEDRGMNDEMTLFERGLTASVGVVQPVFMGGQIIEGNRLAKVGEEAARAKREMVQRDLEIEVEKAYWMCVTLEEKRKTIDRMQALLDTLSRTVDRAVAGGMATEVDRLKVRLKQDELDANKLRLNNGIRLARRALAATIGIEYTDDMHLADSLEAEIKIEYSLNDTSTAERAEMSLLECGVKAEKIRYRMERGKAMPQAVVGAGWAWSNMVLWEDHRHEGDNGMVWVGVRVPLTDWWGTAHKMHERRLAIEQAELKREEMREQMVLQQEQLRMNLEEAEAICKKTERSVEKAEETYRLSLLGYETGMQTISDMLEAQTMLSNALNNLAEARMQRTLAYRKYMILTKK